MTWTRLSDTFTENPDFLKVSRSARLLHVEALCYCNKWLTDGKLPVSALPRICDDPSVKGLVEELARAGIWGSGGVGLFQLDWTEQEKATAVTARREHRNRTQQRYRDRTAAHKSGDHGLCDRRYCTEVT